MTDKSELLTCIRTFRQQVMNQLDILEDAVLSAGAHQPKQTTQVQNTESHEWLTAREVCKCLKIGQTTFYEHIKAGLLPDGVAFGPRSKRWRMSDIIAHKNRAVAEERPITTVRRRGRVSRIRKIGEFVHA